MDIVILHGWNLSGERFLPLADELRKAGHRVFTPDLPGFGREAAPKIPWHVSDYANFLYDIVQKKHLQRPVLIGHSFGGRVALVYAQLYPDMPAALILTGAPGFSPAPSLKRIVFWIIAKVTKVFFALPPFHLFEKRARAFLYRASGSREFLRAQGTMKQTFKYVVADPLLPAMESLRIPCLLLWGEKDHMVPISIAYRMRRSIANATLKIIPGRDHAVPYRDAAGFAREVKNFLNTL